MAALKELDGLKKTVKESEWCMNEAAKQLDQMKQNETRRAMAQWVVVVVVVMI